MRKKELNLTQKEFSKKAGIPLRTLIGIERDERKPGYNLLVKLCKIAGTYNVSIQWLMFGEESQKKLPSIIAETEAEYGEKVITAIPVINEVPAGYPDIPILDDHITNHVYVPGIPKGTFGLYVSGNSMFPELNDRDIVIINPASKDFRSGELGVFRLITGVTVKYYYKEGGKAWLQPRNPKYSPIILTDDLECTAIGKVVCKIIMVKK